MGQSLFPPRYSLWDCIQMPGVVSRHPVVTWTLLRDVLKLKDVTAVMRLLATVSPCIWNAAEPIRHRLVFLAFLYPVIAC